MTAVRHMTAALAIVAISACNPFHRTPAVQVTRDDNAHLRWSGTLTSPATLTGVVQIGGVTAMRPADKGGSRITVDVSNATPGGVHPWQLHRGQCGADEGVFGSASSYPALKVGGNGRASATTTIPIETPTEGRFFVVVGASQSNPETVVACGNLAAPTQ